MTNISDKKKNQVFVKNLLSDDMIFVLCYYCQTYGRKNYTLYQKS